MAHGRMDGSLRTGPPRAHSLRITRASHMLAHMLAHMLTHMRAHPPPRGMKEERDEG